MGSIYVGDSDQEGTSRFRVVICQGYKQMVYGIVSRTSVNCPAGQVQLHGYEFHALSGGECFE